MNPGSGGVRSPPVETDRRLVTSAPPRSFPTDDTLTFLPGRTMPGKPIRVTVTRTLAAPAPQVYDILADYRRGHPSILPARAFTHLTVEEGGRGEGTVIRFGMKAFGKVNEARAAVTEPEPGRVLVETVLDGSDVVTVFKVAPVAGGHASVTIDTTWTPKGPGALFERLAAPLFLKGVYKEELGNLEKVATGAL